MAIDLDNKIIFIDTAPLIYFIEKNKKYIDILDEMFRNESVFWITSVLTLTEILILPLRLKRYDLIDTYKSFLINSKNLQLIDIDTKISLESAFIRAEYNFKTPDSIQLACAMDSNTDFFLTNDISLKKFKSKPVLLLEDLL